MAPNTVAVVESDWNPLLVRAPHLISKLSFCIALAASREAAQIELSDANLEYKDLASNLVMIANRGQNAFMEAYSDMLQIGSKTNEMGRNGGSLDQLLDLFGDSTAERATRRLLNGLQLDIKACNESGKRTAKDFLTWQTGVQGLHRAVLGAQSETVRALNDTEKEMRLKSENIARINNDLTKIEVERQEAHEKHKQAIRNQNEREAVLNSYSAQVAKFGLAAAYPLAGALVGAGVSAWLSASAAKTVATAEAAIAEKRQAARNLDHVMKNIEIDLGKFQSEKGGLEYLKNAICAVLGLLAGVVQDIMSVIAFFKVMNNEIANMVEEHDRKLKDIADQEADGEVLRDADFEHFYLSAKQMKKLALTIHTLSSLYSKIITETVNPGFALAVKASHHVNGDSAMVIAQKQSGMQTYVEEAEQQCIESNKEANKALRARMEEIDRAKPSKKQQKSAKKHKQKRLGFFSRLSSSS